jgi:hypothetical protein
MSKRIKMKRLVSLLVLLTLTVGCSLPLKVNYTAIEPLDKITKNYQIGKESKVAGSRYFCESLFWASQPKQAAKT